MKKIECLNAILELIEDEQYPAKRNITDYVLLLLGNYEDRKTLENLEKHIEAFYKNVDSTSHNSAMLQGLKPHAGNTGTSA